MQRWFYILVGGLGLSVAAGAGAALIWMQHPGQPMYQLIMEGAVIPVGLALAIIGIVNGRNAGELDIKQYLKAPRRDHGVNGGEIHFQCPACRKAYQASPLLMGKQFSCRDCRQVFEVVANEGNRIETRPQRLLSA